MLNQVVLMGRLTSDPEAKCLNDSYVVRFSLAVERDYKAANEDRKADFINCTAWNKTGEFIKKFFKKGNMLAVVGTIETGSYEKDGRKVYTTEVRVKSASFTGEKTGDKPTEGIPEPVPPAGSDGFMNIPDNIDEELPFN